jgi:hypothetical protein
VNTKKKKNLLEEIFFPGSSSCYRPRENHLVPGFMTVKTDAAFTFCLFTGATIAWHFRRQGFQMHLEPRSPVKLNRFAQARLSCNEPHGPALCFEFFES